MGDLDIVNLRKALKNNMLVNKIVLQELGLSIDEVDTISEGALLQVFNKIIKMRDFHSKIGAGQYKSLIPNEIQQLLSKTQIPEYSLDDKDYARLNRALLEAVYPLKSQKTLIIMN